MVATGVFFILGVVAGRLWSMWRKHRQKRSAERGHSEDVVTIEKILLDRRKDGTQVLRIRSCGRDTIETVFPNQAARDDFQSPFGGDDRRSALGFDGRKDGFLFASGAGDLGLWPTEGARLPA